MNGCTHKLILGPPFFNLYINDLPTIPKSGSLESFVDDSRLYLSFQMLLRLPKDFHVTLLGKEVTPSNSARDLEIEMYRNGRSAKLWRTYYEHSHLVLLAYARLTELNIFLTQSLWRMLSTLWYLVNCFIVLLYGPVLQRRTSPNCSV